MIDRVDTLSAVLGEDRTDLIVTALLKYLEGTTRSDGLVQEIAGAYYDGIISYRELTSLVGAETASNFRALKQQLAEDYIEDVAEL